MNAEALLAHYARIADAPDAIARLRRFVLDLAVRGKLVAQESGDEPAAKLLERITAEKTRLIQAGTIRKAKPAPPSEKASFAIPSAWAWSQIAEIGILSPRNDAADDMQASFVPMNLISAEYGEPNGHEVRLWREIKKGYTHFSEGDVGLAKITPCFENGKSTVFRNLAGKLGSGTTELHVVRPLLINPDYVLVFLKSPHFIESGIPRMTGTAGQKRVPTDYFAYSPFPLPPLAEQQRIVAKVDELMALCDQLEAARAQREATRDRLAAASLARLNAPDPDTFHADARVALDALPALTKRPDQIKQLRQTILNLAVRGKLVPQDPVDAKAGDERHSLEHRPELIPPTWRYCALEDLLAEDTRNGYSRRPDDDPNGTPILRISAGTVRADGVVAELEHKLISGIDEDVRHQYGLRSGDLLACRFNGNKAYVGRLTIFEDRLGLSPIYPDKLIRIRISEDAASARFIRLAGETDLVRTKIDAACATTVGNWGISATNLKKVQFPVPPIPEQHRIVAKVDELMALCDQLEASLTAGKTTRSRLLDALLHEALAPAPAMHVEHPRAAVSGYVVSRLASKRNFGRTAHMKYLYLAESRLGLKLGGHYERQAAGPLDTGLYELEKHAEAAGWYTCSVEKPPSGKVRYVPGPALKALAEDGAAVLGTSRKEMDRLINLMGGLTTEQVEIIATLFAAWNDALIDGHTPDDDWIVKEVREHWHVSKQRFKPDNLRTWLRWMLQNDVVPLSHPPRTMQQATMEL